MEKENKLLQIQLALKAPKDMVNAFGRYKYRSCERILEEVKPLLGKHGLILTLTDEIVPVATRIYVRATATLKDGEIGLATVTAWAREEETKKGMDASQITGASSSYARKYALNGLFLIDDARDSDATNTGEGQDRKQEEEQNQEPQGLPPQKPAKPATLTEEVEIEDVTRSKTTGVFTVKCAKNKIFTTQKEVLALLSRGLKGKKAVIEYTVDPDMNIVPVDVRAPEVQKKP